MYETLRLLQKKSKVIRLSLLYLKVEHVEQTFSSAIENIRKGQNIENVPLCNQRDKLSHSILVDVSERKTAKSLRQSQLNLLHEIYPHLLHFYDEKSGLGFDT